MIKDHKHRRAKAKYLGDVRHGTAVAAGTRANIAPVSKYGYATHNSPEQTELTSVLRRGSRSSGRKITMLKISKGKSDE